MEKYEIATVKEINSAGIKKQCQATGITEIEFLGRFPHPDLDAIRLYRLPTGIMVADTNGDPVWESAAGFGRLIEEYEIEL